MRKRADSSGAADCHGIRSVTLRGSDGDFGHALLYNQTLPNTPDIFCLDCGYPLARDKNTCPECGRAFDAEDPSTVSIRFNRGPLEKLYVGNEFDGYILRDMLAEEGIPSVIMGQSLGAVRGDLPMTPDTMPSLWVGQMDVQQALRIANEFDRIKREGPANSDADVPWTCPRCAEEIEGHFHTCWNCGTDRVVDSSQS